MAVGASDVADHAFAGPVNGLNVGVGDEVLGLTCWAVDDEHDVIVHPQSIYEKR